MRKLCLIKLAAKTCNPAKFIVLTLTNPFFVSENHITIFFNTTLLLWRKTIKGNWLLAGFLRVFFNSLKCYNILVLQRCHQCHDHILFLVHNTFPILLYFAKSFTTKGSKTCRHWELFSKNFTFISTHWFVAAAKTPATSLSSDWWWTSCATY